MVHVGVSSVPWGVPYCGGYHALLFEYCGGHHDTCGRIS